MREEGRNKLALRVGENIWRQRGKKETFEYVDQEFNGNIWQ